MQPQRSLSCEKDNVRKIIDNNNFMILPLSFVVNSLITYYNLKNKQKIIKDVTKNYNRIA
tara:strand:+ start:679 stop:858 length:180 start_codon:yes stop_codon:yes gene_type:complete